MWHSVKKDGTPTVPGRYFVTAVDEDGKRVVYVNYAWCDWSWQIWDEEDEEWYYSDDDDVIAWMPFPEPYDGD